MSKIFYRVSNHDGEGLWYDQYGNFTGLIHTKFNFCVNNRLPMPFDEDIRGYLSAAQTLDELWIWFPREDVLKLQKHNVYISVYSATDYKEHSGHWVINENSSVFEGNLILDPINGFNIGFNKRQPYLDKLLMLRNGDLIYGNQLYNQINDVIQILSKI